MTKKAKKRTTLHVGDDCKPINLDALLQHHSDELKQMKDAVRNSEVVKQIQKTNPNRPCKPENEEIYMLRFLLNPKYTIEEAANRFIHCIESREKYAENLERYHRMFQKVLESDYPESGQVYLPHANKMFRYFPEVLHYMTDRWGQPINLQIGGSIDWQGMYKNVSQTELEEFALAKMEYIRMFVDKRSRETNQFIQWITVLDMHGLSMFHLHMKMLQRISKVSKYGDSMYKENLGRIWVVNEPSIFQYIFKAGKFIMSERSAQKVNVVGSDLTKLTKILDNPKQLPDSLWHPKKASGLDIQFPKNAEGEKQGQATEVAENGIEITT